MPVSLRYRQAGSDPRLTNDSSATTEASCPPIHDNRGQSRKVTGRPDGYGTQQVTRRTRSRPICTQAAARLWASGGVPKGQYVAAARLCVAELVGSRITSRAGSVLILGCQKDGTLVNSDGGEVLAAQGRVDRSPGDPRPARRRPFGYGPHRSGRAPGVVARSVPRDLRGHAAGDVVRQVSDDDRDGRKVFGRLARHGQHGVVLAAPGWQVRPGASGLSCPAR